MEFVRDRLGFEGLFVVDPVGRSGGLALLWKEKNEVEIQNYTRKHINAVIKHTNSTQLWRLTSFYGHPSLAKWHESQALLSHLRSFGPEPWLCIGDFNEEVEQSKKFRGVRKKESQMVNFRNVLAKCGLSDLGFKGSKYTWANCQSNDNFIKERLDRAVANAAWCDMHQSIEVKSEPLVRLTISQQFYNYLAWHRHRCISRRASKWRQVGCMMKNATKLSKVLGGEM